jgi:hypothetical protein
MANRIENQPFKNREQIKAEIRLCAWANIVFQLLSFLFAALGVIGEAFNTTIGLQSIIWLLLAILTSLHAIIPAMHVVVAKHLLGIEAESKKE